MAEIRTTKYSSELQKLVFPDNSFYKKSKQETGVADSVVAVERPVQKSTGKAKEGAVKQYPRPITIAEDGKDTYPVIPISAEPVLVTSESEILTNYSYRKTKQDQQADEINTQCANYAARMWLPNKSELILKTTGAARATNVLGLTGNRKAVIKADLLKIQNILMRMNMGGDMNALVTADFYTDLLGIDQFVDYEKTGNTSKLEKGIIGRLLGIEFHVRSNDEFHIGALYDNASTPAVVKQVLTNTNRPANLFWSSKCVCSAEGKLKTSVNPDRADYDGGTIISSRTRFGAAKCYDDERGVVALIEDNA